MLKLFMDAIGPFSKKMLKRHFISYERLQLHSHFETETLAFRRHDVDKVTGQKVIRVVLVTNPVFAKQIGQIMIKARSDTDQRGDVMRLADLLANVWSWIQEKELLFMTLSNMISLHGKIKTTKMFKLIREQEQKLWTTNPQYNSITFKR